MNIFRLVGDLSHLLAIIILLVKMWTSRSCSGMLDSCTVHGIWFAVSVNKRLTPAGRKPASTNHNERKATCAR